MDPMVIENIDKMYKSLLMQRSIINQQLIGLAQIKRTVLGLRLTKDDPARLEYLNKIAAVVCDYAGTSIEELRSVDRHRDLVNARIVITQVARNLVVPNYTWKYIASRCLQRDHSSVINAQKNHYAWYHTNPDYTKFYDGCINALKKAELIK